MNTTTLFWQSIFINFFMNFVPIIILVIILYFLLINVIKKYEKKSEEKFLLAKQNSLQTQQLLEKYEDRLSHIEKLIRDVD